MNSEFFRTLKLPDCFTVKKSITKKTGCDWLKVFIKIRNPFFVKIFGEQLKKMQN